MFNEILSGGFILRFGGVVIDMLLVFGIKGELENDIIYDVSLNFGENEVDFFISNMINLLLGLDIFFEFSSGCYI